MRPELDQGTERFFKCIETNDIAGIEQLFEESRVSMESRNLLGDNPFQYALRFRAIPVIEYFARNQADNIDINVKNEQGNTYVQVCVKNRFLKGIEIILQHFDNAVDLESVNNLGLNAFDMATNPEIEELLMKYKR